MKTKNKKPIGGKSHEIFELNCLSRETGTDISFTLIETVWSYKKQKGETTIFKPKYAAPKVLKKHTMVLQAISFHNTTILTKCK